MKRFLIASLASLIIGVPALAGLGRAEAAEKDMPVQSPLKDEMQTLNAVFQKVVTAVSLGDGEAVTRALEAMHGKEERTAEALHSGAVRPPKNADKLDEFERLDRKFHKELDLLASAARKNDRQKMLTLTKRLLDGCVECHSAFRR
ncbi:MAG: cytochrome c [Deltaproteobacteria bacterium]|nr:cytochrome c [Deltaproteobacteria bacterium]